MSKMKITTRSSSCTSVSTRSSRRAFADLFRTGFRAGRRRRVGISAVILSVAVLAVSAAGAHAGEDENRVQDPNFDVGVSLWVDAAAPPVHDMSLDVDGSPSSGSMLLAGDDVFIFPPSARHCVSIDGYSGLSDMGAWVYLPPDSGVTEARITATYYGSSDCSGADAGFHESVAVPLVAGSWVLVSREDFPVPATNGSAWVRIEGNLGTSPMTINVDRVYLGPDGSTPVELLSFSVE